MFLLRFAIFAAGITTAVGAGCVDRPAEIGDIGQTAAPIIGGAPTTAFPAVGFLQTSVGQCTGTLIAPHTVITAAHCIYDSIVNGQIGGSFSFGAGGGTFDEEIAVVDMFAHRYYDPGVIRKFDVGLVRLATVPVGIEPMVWNEGELDATLVGAEVVVVGYGVTDGETQTGGGEKRQVGLTVDTLTAEHLGVGDANRNICQGDSGGPTILNIDGVDTVLAVSSFGSNFCMNRSFVTRTDIFRNDFIYEVLAAWDGPCPRDGNCDESGCGEFADPDCGLCGLEGVCGTGCDKVDLDCPVGAFIGQECGSSDDCESRRCVEAPEDSRVKYCSEVCDPGNPQPCAAPLGACESVDGENLCVYEGPTPRAQGSPCAAGEDCRSGECHPDEKICIEQCGGDLPSCPDPFVCDDYGGTKACIFDEGCGCRAGRGGAGAGLAFLSACVGLLWLHRRRRRRS